MNANKLVCTVIKYYLVKYEAKDSPRRSDMTMLTPIQEQPTPLSLRSKTLLLKRTH